MRPLYYINKPYEDIARSVPARIRQKIIMKQTTLLIFILSITTLAEPVLQLSVPEAGGYLISREKAQSYAENAAHERYGICALGEPWEYSDVFGTRIAYMFPVKFMAKRFNPPATSDGWNEGYGQILISAKSYLCPLLETSRAAPPELTQQNMLIEIIRRELGAGEVRLDRIYYMPYGLRAFQFTEGGERYLIDPFTLVTLTGSQFDEFVESLRNPKNAIGHRNSLADLNDRWAKALTDTFESHFIDGYEQVPYFDWEYGCGPTASTMLLGYYENYHNVGRFITGYYTHSDHKFAWMNYHVPDLHPIVAGCAGTDTTYYPPYDYSYGGSPWTGQLEAIGEVTRRKGLPFEVRRVPNESVAFDTVKAELDSSRPVVWSVCWRTPIGNSCHGMTAVGYSEMEHIFLHNTWYRELDDRWTWDSCSIVGYSSYTEEEFTFGELFYKSATLAKPTGTLDARDITLLAPCPGSGLPEEPYWNEPGDLPEYAPGGDLTISWAGADTSLPLIIQLSTNDGISFFEIGFIPYPEAEDSFVWAIPGTLSTNGARARVLQFEDGLVISGDGSYSPFVIGTADSCAMIDAMERNYLSELPLHFTKYPLEVNCTFHNDDDVDWFSFFASPFDSLVFVIGDPASPVVTILDDDFDTVYSCDGAGSNVAFDWMPESPGMHYIVLHKNSLSPPSGCYSIYINLLATIDTTGCLTADSFETDNPFENATLLDITDELQAQRHTLFPINEKDYYKFYLDSNETFWVKTITPQPLQILIKLFDYSESFVLSGVNGLQFRAHEPDTYYILLREYIAAPEERPRCYDIFYKHDYYVCPLRYHIPVSDTAVVGRFYSFVPNFIWNYYYPDAAPEYEFCDYPLWMTAADTVISGIPPVADTVYYFSVTVPVEDLPDDTVSVGVYVRDCPCIADTVLDSVDWGEHYVFRPALDGASLILAPHAWLSCDGDSIFGTVPDGIEDASFQWVAYTPYCVDTQVLILYCAETGVAETEVPDIFALEPLHPNPTNSSALVTFATPVEGEAIIKLIDITGRQIEEKRLQILTPGWHRVTLNLDGLSSGVYLVKASFAGEARYRKLTLIK